MTIEFIKEALKAGENADIFPEISKIKQNAKHPIFPTLHRSSAERDRAAFNRAIIRIICRITRVYRAM